MTDRAIKSDLVIRGGTVVLAAAAESLDIGVADGKIVAITDRDVLPTAGTEIDASGKYVLPGAIDAHTHVEWPFGPNNALRSRDTFESATEAAVISGTTTIIDFVPPDPSRSHLEAAHRRLKQASGHCATDFSFHPMLRDASPQTIGDIGELTRLGMSSFKIFTAIEQMRLDDGEIYAVMNAIAEAGGLAGFHAENEGIVRHALQETISTYGPSIEAFPRTRPAIAEAAAIGLVGLYARKIGLPIYIFHVTSRDALQAIADARSQGTQVRAETCTHYLTFDESVYQQNNGWMYVILPPIRQAPDRAALWAGLADGTLSCVSSDHCAYGYDQKEPGFADFRAMPGGAPGLEARAPMVWSEGVSGHRITPVDYARIMALEPARTFGLYPRKGVIQIGADADLMLIDPERSWSWPAFNKGTARDWDPFAGMRGTGLPTMTIIRGRVAAKEGTFVGRHDGEFLRQVIDPSIWSDRP